MPFERNLSTEVGGLLGVVAPAAVCGRLPFKLLHVSILQHSCVCSVRAGRGCVGLALGLFECGGVEVGSCGEDGLLAGVEVGELVVGEVA